MGDMITDLGNLNAMGILGALRRVGSINSTTKNKVDLVTLVGNRVKAVIRTV